MAALPLADPCPEAAVFRNLCLPELQSAVGIDVFDSWFSTLRLDRVDNGVAHLSIATRFLKHWLDGHYLTQILACLRSKLVGVAQIEIRVRARGTSVVSADRTPMAVAAPPPATFGVAAPIVHRPSPAPDVVQGIIEPEYTFDTYRSSDSNRVAFASARELLEATLSGARSPFSPLVLTGETGFGKTHLAHAVAWRARENDRDVFVLDPGRLIANELQKSGERFWNALQRAHLVVFDDVHHVRSRTHADSFDRVMRVCATRSIPLIATSVPPVIELENLSAETRSRLAAGLACPIGAPDFALRRSVLDCMVAARPDNFAPDDSIRDAIATAMLGLRDLRGALNRLASLARSGVMPANADAALLAVGDLVKAREVRTPKIDEIQRVVADLYGVRRQDILSARRTAAVVRPRQVAMFLAKDMTPKSLPEIGRRFGGRDHTTVLHAVRKIETLCQSDRGTHEIVGHARSLLLDGARP